MEAVTKRRVEQIRQRIINLSFRARSAHLGSSLSCVEILDAVLRCSNLRPDNLTDTTRDRIVISKGHAAMGYYSVLIAHDLLPVELLDNYLADDTVLWGHVSVTPHAPAIDYSTGSLGHGLGLALGHALAYRLKKNNGRIFCVMSDGECNEGSVWEAAQFAGHHKLNSVAALVDYNKIQSLDFCKDVLDPEPFGDKWRAFGWAVTELADGHDSDAIFNTLQAVPDKPHLILCHTVKGKGIPRIENTVASHYRPATEADVVALGDKL